MRGVFQILLTFHGLYWSFEFTNEPPRYTFLSCFYSFKSCPFTRGATAVDSFCSDTDFVLRQIITLRQMWYYFDFYIVRHPNKLFLLNPLLLCVLLYVSRLLSFVFCVCMLCYFCYWQIDLALGMLVKKETSWIELHWIELHHCYNIIYWLTDIFIYLVLDFGILKCMVIAVKIIRPFFTLRNDGVKKFPLLIHK